MLAYNTRNGSCQSRLQATKGRQLVREKREQSRLCLHMEKIEINHYTRNNAIVFERVLRSPDTVLLSSQFQTVIRQFLNTRF